MLLDTGAEVTILPSDFLNRLCPGQEFPDKGRTVRSLGGNHISVKGPITLTIEICCRILSHQVYFCDGASTPLLGYDAISAASLVIDTEARQIWSKDIVLFEKTVPFTPSRSDTSPTAEPSTFVSSSDISLTITDPFPSVTTLSPSVVDLCATAASATTVTSSDIVVLSETVRLPARESSEPYDYCSAAPTTSSSTTIDLDDSACATATVSPASDSVQLDPLAPSFVPASVIASPSVFTSDSVVNNCRDEYELSEDTQLKVPVSPSDTREVELPDHVNDLFLQTVEGLDLPHETIKGLKQLLHDYRETFASSSSDLGFCLLVEHDIDTGDARPIKQSPRVIQQPSLQPTEVGEGAMSLAPEYEALYSLTFPDSPLGVAEPPVVPLLPEGSVRTLGLAPENLETPPPTFSGRRKRPEPLQPCAHFGRGSHDVPHPARAGVNGHSAAARICVLTTDLRASGQAGT